MMPGRPGLTATRIRRTGQDEQDPSPVRQGLQGSLVFRVEAVRDTSPVTYIMADAWGEPTRGISMAQNSRKSRRLTTLTWNPSWTWASGEKVIEYLVKWAGYPPSFNSSERDVVLMASPALALDSTMVFTLPSNASQALYPDNTVTDFRVALPECVALRNNDYEVALASFTYACSWYNVPDHRNATISSLRGLNVHQESQDP